MRPAEEGKQKNARWASMIYRSLSVVLDTYLNPTETEIQSSPKLKESFTAEAWRESFQQRMAALKDELRKGVNHENEGWLINEAFEVFNTRLCQVEEHGQQTVVGLIKGQFLTNETEFVKTVIKDVIHIHNLLQHLEPATKNLFNITSFDPEDEMKELAEGILNEITSKYPSATLISYNDPITIDLNPVDYKRGQRIVRLHKNNPEGTDPNQYKEFRVALFGKPNPDKTNALKIANDFLQKFNNEKQNRLAQIENEVPTMG